LNHNIVASFGNPCHAIRNINSLAGSWLVSIANRRSAVRCSDAISG
jgi:hypothetical protein